MFHVGLLIDHVVMSIGGDGEVIVVVRRGQSSRRLEPDSPALAATTNECARKHQHGIENRLEARLDSDLCERVPDALVATSLARAEASSQITHSSQHTHQGDPYQHGFMQLMLTLVATART